MPSRPRKLNRGERRSAAKCITFRIAVLTMESERGLDRLCSPSIRLAKHRVRTGIKTDMLSHKMPKKSTRTADMSGISSLGSDQVSATQRVWHSMVRGEQSQDARAMQIQRQGAPSTTRAPQPRAKEWEGLPGMDSPGNDIEKIDPGRSLYTGMAF